MKVSSEWLEAKAALISPWTVVWTLAENIHFGAWIWNPVNL